MKFNIKKFVKENILHKFCVFLLLKDQKYPSNQII
jgi:hypothetical protein